MALIRSDGRTAGFWFYIMITIILDIFPKMCMLQRDFFFFPASFNGLKAFKKASAFHFSSPQLIQELAK